VANRPGLLLPVTWKVSAWADSLLGPDDRAVAQLGTAWAGASSLTAWSAPLVKVGASLTGLTVMVNVCAALVLTWGSYGGWVGRDLILGMCIAMGVARALQHPARRGFPVGERPVRLPEFDVPSSADARALRR